jgi:hypothetical protein
MRKKNKCSLKKIKMLEKQTIDPAPHMNAHANFESLEFC